MYQKCHTNTNNLNLQKANSCTFCREGFEQSRIDALLHKIELSQKHQTDNFGLGIAFVSIGYRSYITIIKELSGNERSK